MNAVVDPQRARPPQVPPLVVAESRDFRSYQDFLRAARNYVEGALVPQMRDAYEQRTAAQPPTDWRAAEAVLDGQVEYQLYCWYYRNLQRFKYHRPALGIFDTVQSQRGALLAQLEATAAATPPERLRLNPALRYPDYFQWVPFHQHTGGVTHDALDGIAYEIGRRTTVPAHVDPNGIYRMLFETLPQRRYARVLDWGIGHGAALITWQQLHPDSECHGVDLSAPCLKLANQRAAEHGYAFWLSQQDLEHLDYPDGHFDLLFFNFMLHEIPPAHYPALFAEARRVLRPGGLFAGHEFHLRPGDAFQNAVHISNGWTNNETYAAPWYGTRIEEVARQAGFSRTSIRPFERLMRSVERPGRKPVNLNCWNLYTFEK
ncbi:MAG: class I SAM-dependent methyltransferase [Steroidobacteraceae bacterium]